MTIIIYFFSYLILEMQGLDLREWTANKLPVMQATYFLLLRSLATMLDLVNVIMELLVGSVFVLLDRWPLRQPTVTYLHYCLQRLGTPC